MAEHYIHRPDDGRGARNVYVDGKPVKNVIYADTLRGIVRHNDDPPVVDVDGTTFRQHELRGTVYVEFIPDRG